jgi:putative transcriptional regulator
LISNKVLVLRLERKMTQEELARELGVTRQTIISLEKNKYVPSLEMGFKVARLFGKTIEEVFEYAE